MVQAVDITVRATTGAATITATGLILTAGMLDGDEDDVVRRWNDTAKRWEIVESGEQLPGPSKNDLYFVKTNGDGDETSGGDDGLYKFDGSDWAIDTNTSLASAEPIDSEARPPDHRRLVHPRTSRRTDTRRGASGSSSAPPGRS